jgi:hypothetical protein
MAHIIVLKSRIASETRMPSTEPRPPKEQSLLYDQSLHPERCTMISPAQQSPPKDQSPKTSHQRPVTTKDQSLPKDPALHRPRAHQREEVKPDRSSASMWNIGFHYCWRWRHGVVEFFIHICGCAHLSILLILSIRQDSIYTEHNQYLDLWLSILQAWHLLNIAVINLNNILSWGSPYIWWLCRHRHSLRPGTKRWVKGMSTGSRIPQHHKGDRRYMSRACWMIQDGFHVSPKPALRAHFGSASRPKPWGR